MRHSHTRIKQNNIVIICLQSYLGADGAKYLIRMLDAI